MVADGRKRRMFTLLGIDALVLTAVAITFGAGIAGADPNDPGMTVVRPDGHVDSPQSASTSGAKPCAVDPGTLPTSSSSSSDVGVPMQQAHEAGPEWVGSRGWQAVNISPSDPWGGNFNPQSTRTGPQCKPSKAHHF